MINILKIKDIKNIICVGDIHGEFTKLSYKIGQFRTTNTLFIVCGDIGVGFMDIENYYSIFLELENQIKYGDNHVVMFRGNHDDPSYFNDKTNENFKFLNNVHLIPDYTIIEASGEIILCIGGAISIDRVQRQERDLNRYLKTLKESKSYWGNEGVIYDHEKLKHINNIYEDQITIVCTHSAPSIANPKGTLDLSWWFAMDKTLKQDLEEERELLDKIYEDLVRGQLNIERWFYGHYHSSYSEVINGIDFKLLDEHEFKDLHLDFTK